MITSDGRVKILDFGLAKLMDFDTNGVQTDLPTRQVNTDAGAVMVDDRAALQDQVIAARHRHSTNSNRRP